MEWIQLTIGTAAKTDDWQRDIRRLNMEEKMEEVGDD